MGLVHTAPSGARQLAPSVNVDVYDASERAVQTDFTDLICIGVSRDGDPEQSYSGSLDDLRAILGDEEMSFSDGYSVNPIELLGKAADPSPDPAISGAKNFHWQDVGYGTKTRAQWDLDDGGGDPIAVIKRRRPGLTDMRLMLGPGTTFPDIGLKVSVMENGTTFAICDDIGPAIYVQGPTGSTVTTTRKLFTPADGTAQQDRMTYLECKVSGARKLLANLLSSDYYTIAQLAAAIAAIDGGDVWESYVAPGVDGSLPSYFLDLYTAEACDAVDGEGNPIATLLTANVGALIYALQTSPLIYAEKAADALNTRYTLPAVYADYTAPTTPGAFTTPSVADWLTAIGRAEDAFPFSAHVMIATDNQTVARYLAARCEYHQEQGDMNNWRAFVGHPVTSDYFGAGGLAKVKDDRRRINAYHTVFCGASEFYDNAAGVQEEVSRGTMWLAAALAGMRAGNYRKSLTHKQVRCNGLVRKLTQAEMSGTDGLIANRVTFLRALRDGTVRVMRGLVSYSGGTRSAECNEFAGWIKWYLRAWFQTNYQWVFGEIVDGEVMLPSLKAAIYQDLTDLSTGANKILTADPSTGRPAFTIHSVTFAENAFAVDISVGAVDEGLWLDIWIGFTVQRLALAA